MKTFEEKYLDSFDTLPLAMKIALKEVYESGIEESKPKWTSTEEQQPVEPGYYLCLEKYHDEPITRYWSGSKWSLYHINYWMPMPNYKDLK